MTAAQTTLYFLTGLNVVLGILNLVALWRARRSDQAVMRTANSTLANRQAAQALHAANQPMQRRRVRALGASNQEPPARLPPSYPPSRQGFPTNPKRTQP